MSSESDQTPPVPIPESRITNPESRLAVPWAVILALTMSVIGLAVGLWVSHAFDNRKLLKETLPPRPEGAVLPATQLEGLGYLPADTNIAFAVQPGAVLAYATRTKQDARELMVKAGIPAKALDAIANLGITLAQIDHIAGGMCIGDGAAELRFTLALVLRHPPDDEDEFLRKIKAQKQAGGKARYKVELAGFPMTLARVSPTVWVFGFDQKKDMEAVDRGGYGVGGKQFPAGLVRMIEQEVPPQAAAWVATDDGRWAEKPAVKLIVATGLKKPELLPVLARGRAGVAAVGFDDPPWLRLVVKATDKVTGQQTLDYFRERAATDDQIRVAGDSELASLHIPIDPATAFATLQQLLGDASRK